MKTDSISDQDNQLVAKTKNFVSRHQDIPPTPRDTMAVLMQAAEQQKQEKSASIFAPYFMRWATGIAAVLLLTVAGWWTLMPSSQQNVASINVEAISVDAGIDVAEWDLEIDTLMSEFDTSLASLSDDYVMNN